MKIEVGKRYKRWDGEISGPVEKVVKLGDSRYPFEADGNSYTPDGKYWDHDEPHPADLIEEYVEETKDTPKEEVEDQTSLLQMYKNEVERGYWTRIMLDSSQKEVSRLYEQSKSLVKELTAYKAGLRAVEKELEAAKKELEALRPKPKLGKAFYLLGMHGVPILCGENEAEVVHEFLGKKLVSAKIRNDKGEWV